MILDLVGRGKGNETESTTTSISARSRDKGQVIEGRVTDTTE
jgi:hypothetical protein